MSEDDNDPADQDMRVAQGGGAAKKQMQQLLSGGATSFAFSSPEAQRDHMRAAVARVEVAATKVREDRVRRVTEHNKAGRPPLPTNSPRIALLERSIAPASTIDRNERARSDVGKLDRSLAAMARDITRNPLWLAADHVERNAAPLQLEALVRESPELRQAKELYATAEKQFLTAKTQVEEFEKRPAWAQWIDSKVRDTDLKLREAYDQSAERLLGAKQHVEATERDVRASLEVSVAEHNGAELNKQREARERRESLEQPLREAFIERHVAEAIARGDASISRIQDVPEGTSLKQSGVIQLGGFDVVQLTDAQGKTYLGDSVTLDLPSTGLEQGASLAPNKQPDGTVKLSIEVASQHTLDRGPVEGKVVDLQWEQGRLTKVTLEQADNKRVSIVPQGDNLLKEVPGMRKLTELEHGASVHVTKNRGVQMLTPKPAIAVALAR